MKNCLFSLCKRFFTPNYLFRFSLFFLLAVSFSQTLLLLDPDFGWHLRMGKVILSSGIPKTDPFSYTMPSFPFIDHEWLTNVILFELYSWFGKIPLTLFFTFLAFISLRLTVKTKTSLAKSTVSYLWQNAWFLLAFASLLPFLGVRPQLFTWFFLAIMLPLFFGKAGRKSVLPLWLPFFTLGWTNLHGSFPLALILPFIYLFFRSLRIKIINYRDWLIVAFSLLATFINPYGPRIWQEVWQQISDSQLRFRIQEWSPAFFSFNLPFLATAVFSFFLNFHFRKKIPLERKAIYLFLLFQATASVRHIPLFVIFSTPLALKGFRLLEKEILPLKEGKERLLAAITYLLKGVIILSVIAGCLQIHTFVANAQNFYPVQAVRYLRQHLPENELFSSYDWGGYLIWHLPEKKVFIDGRMPSWRWQANLSKESNNAMNEYMDILQGKKDYAEIFTHYRIDTVLLPPLTEPGLMEKISRLVWPSRKASFNLLQTLVDAGWKEIYRDQTAVIMKRP